MPRKARLIIVGGSAAGPSAAAKAKRVSKDLEVMIFEKGDFVSYGS
jgi:flavin-dependent dehydrogenase